LLLLGGTSSMPYRKDNKTDYRYHTEEQSKSAHGTPITAAKFRHQLPEEGRSCSGFLLMLLMLLASDLSGKIRRWRESLTSTDALLVNGANVTLLE
jgi:hypothetical protein